MDTWQKCCRGRRSNCPHIKVDGDVMNIRDDYGNIVSMTIDQFQDVHLKLNEILVRREVTESSQESIGSAR